VSPGAETAPRRGVRHLVREQRGTVVLAGLLLVYLVARLLALWRFEVFTSFDTGAYAPRPGITEPFDTVSFTGASPRTWGAPLLFAVVDTDVARALLQWVIGTIAWSLLVVGLWVNVRTLPARVFAAVATIGLALTAPVYTWDFAILSESLSLGLGVMALGLFALWSRTGSRLTATGMAVVGVWWVFTRPDVLPYVVALALVLGIGWYAATVSRYDDAHRKWGLHLGLSESTFLYRLRLQVYPDARVLRVYTRDFEMPSCPAAASVAGQEEWAYAEFVQAYRSCPELVAWTAREKETASIRYALADPVHFARLTKGVMASMLGGTSYASPAKALPRVQDTIFFPSPAGILRVLLGVFSLALVAIVATRALQRATWLAATGTALVVTSGVSALVGSLYSAGAYSRFGIQEAVLMRVGLIMMVTAAIDALVLRRRRRPDRLVAEDVGPSSAAGPA
jgi:hypothetical protein